MLDPIILQLCEMKEKWHSMSFIDRSYILGNLETFSFSKKVRNLDFYVKIFQWLNISKECNAFWTSITKQNTSMTLAHPGGHQFENTAPHLSVSLRVWSSVHMPQNHPGLLAAEILPARSYEHPLLFFIVTTLFCMTLKQCFEKFDI